MLHKKENNFTRIREVVSDFDKNYTWSIWILIYLTYFLFSIILTNIFLPFIQPFDLNSTRYLLSSLAQSQAAIVSIVITLSLVAIQLSATTYTSQAITIYKKSPHIWLLLLSYLITISVSLISLNFLYNSEGVIENQGVFAFILIDFFFSLLLFFALIPYMLNIIDLLNSENIATILIKDLKESTPLDGEEIHSFIEVINSSIIKLDIIILRTWLYVLTQRMYEVALKNPNDFNKIRWSGKFFRLIRDWSDLAISIKNIKAIDELIYNLNYIDISDESSTTIDDSVIECLGYVGSIAAGNGYIYQAESAASSLGIIGTKMIKKRKYSQIASVIYALDHIAESAKKIDRPLCQFGKSFGDIGWQINKNKEFFDLRCQLLFSLTSLTQVYAEKDFWFVTNFLINEIKIIAIPELVTDHESEITIDCFYKIGSLAIKKINSYSEEELNTIRDFAFEGSSDSTHWGKHIDAGLSLAEQLLIMFGRRLKNQEYAIKKTAELAVIHGVNEFNFTLGMFNPQDKFIIEVKRQIQNIQFCQDKTQIRNVIGNMNLNLQS